MAVVRCAETWGSGLALLALASAAWAANVGVVPTKLIVVDKLEVAGKAKAVFVAKDAAATKGAGEDVEQISVQLDVAYENGSATGAFVIPAGSANGWVANKATVAKYVNKEAPGGPTQAKVAVVKPGKLLKLVGKGLGDTPLDILGAGDPAGAVFTAYCVDNAGDENCHCSAFTGCIHKSIAGGTGAKVVCKTGTGDAACSAVVPPTTTTTFVPTCYIDTGLTVIDTCNNLEWEKKDTAVGSGVDAGNLQDVDNRYSWAGCCDGACNTIADLCQPDAAAASTCSAQTGGALGCEECGAGEGTCKVDPFLFGAITTIWDWVNQVNAASFAGHTDWRLATSAGGAVVPTGEPAEMESILDLTQGVCGGGSGACIDPIFGPTAASNYWSASTSSDHPINAWNVGFTGSGIDEDGKDGDDWFVRAVRPSS